MHTVKIQMTGAKCTLHVLHMYALSAWTRAYSNLHSLTLSLSHLVNIRVLWKIEGNMLCHLSCHLE